MEPGSLLEGCRSALARARGRWLPSLRLRRYRIPVPAWASQSGDRRFDHLFAAQTDLLHGGRVVWGALVQANRLLFEQGLDDHPACLVYSLASAVDFAPECLREAARALYSVKGQQTDPALQLFASRLADEMTADPCLLVPGSITRGTPVRYTVTIVSRPHLPCRVLKGSLFPLLVEPVRTQAVMILPCAFWPPALVEAWPAL